MRDPRPLYHRLLRLNHLRLRGPVTFALFEGSIGVAVLLALAEIVSWWGVLAIPVTVALMVKLNDIVAGSLTRPLAFAHLPPPRLAGGIVVGRSPVPRPSRPTTAIAADDAVDDPSAHPDPSPIARGSASSIARGVAVVPAQNQPRRPRPRAVEPEPPLALSSIDSAEFGQPAPPRQGLSAQPGQPGQPALPALPALTGLTGQTAHGRQGEAGQPEQSGQPSQGEVGQPSRADQLWQGQPGQTSRSWQGRSEQGRSEQADQLWQGGPDQAGQADQVWQGGLAQPGQAGQPGSSTTPARAEPIVRRNRGNQGRFDD